MYIIKNVDEHEYYDAHLYDRASRKSARKRGHTQPLSLHPVKRLKLGTSLAMAARECTEEIPSNHYDWFSLPPAKRLRQKSSPKLVMSQWISQADQH